MEYTKSTRTMEGCDVGYNDDLEPLNGVGRVGKRGIDKTLSWDQVAVLAYQIKANIIIKSGKNGKWYLKKINPDDIDAAIEKQKWRDTSRVMMYIIEWAN